MRGIPRTAAALYGMPSSYCSMLCSIRKATGNEYITDPATIPQKPNMLMLSPNMTESMPDPLTPNSAFSPYACDMDGMSIGSVKSMAKKLFPRISVRHTANEAQSARTTEITVAVSVVVTELISAGMN